MNRRDSLKYITLASISAGVISCEPSQKTEEGKVKTPEGYKDLSEEDLKLLEQEFFTEDERETVRQMANLIIPADSRSGNAEDANVVEFIEFMMLDQPRHQTKMRGGLAWINHESLKRFEKDFKDCSENEQKQIFDDIAWPDVAKPEFSQGVSFFNTMRDFTATAFWTSKMGIEDLQYMGNIATVWNGAPQEWLDRLGVSYDN